MAASMYSGAQNLGGVQGFQQGYKFAADSERAEQDAKIKGEQIKKAQYENALRAETFKDVMGGSNEENLTKEVSQLRKQVADQNTNTVRKTVNEATRAGNAKDRDATLSVIKTRFKTNPDIYKSLGIKNADTMGVLNPMDGKDRKWMMDTLAQQGVTAKSMGLEEGSKEWKAAVDVAMDQYPAIKADGAIVDLQGLSTATGSASMANPTHNKVMEENLDKLVENLQKVETTRADNAEAALSTEKGEKADYTELPDSQEGLVNPMKVADIKGKLRETEPTTEEIPTEEVRREVQYEKSAKEDIKATDNAVSTSTSDIKDRKNSEGFSPTAYPDADGMSIGYGHFIKPGEEHLLNAKLSEEEATTLLKKDMATHDKALLKSRPWVAQQPANVQKALKDMAFNMGPNFLDKFPTLDKALQEGDYKTAANVIRNSKYAKQVGKRAQTNAGLIDGSVDAGSVGSNPGATMYMADQMSKQGGTAPLSDMRMRKIYALLGKTYPKDPNEPTAKMKNFEYLKPIVGDAAAFDAIFGKTGNTKLSRMGKLNREQAQYPKGSKEWNQYEAMKDKIMYKGTGGEADKQHAQAVLDGFGDRTDLTEEEQADKYNAIKTLEKQNKTSTQRNQDSSIEHGTEGRKMVNTANMFLDKHPDNKQALADLETAQQKLRIASPKSYQDEKEAIQDLKKKQISVNRVADVLNRVNHGDLQDIKRGAVDSLKQWGATKLDKFTKGLMNDATDGKWSETAKQNLKLGTALGLLQAEFIKAISGATVTDEERKILVKTMVGGGGWDTEEALKTSLTEFYEAEKESMAYSGEQLTKGTSPYDGRQYSSAKGLGKEYLQERNKVGDKYQGMKIIGRNPATGEIRVIDENGKQKTIKVK